MRDGWSASGSRHSTRGKAWRRRMTLLLVASLVVLLGILYLFRGVKIHRLERELGLLSSQGESALVTQERLRERLALRDDPETIENLARAHLGLIRPGEEKVIFIEGD